MQLCLKAKQWPGEQPHRCDSIYSALEQSRICSHTQPSEVADLVAGADGQSEVTYGQAITIIALIVNNLALSSSLI